jgi:adenylate cyclase class IV
LDEVYQVGSFVEVEILTEDENYEQAQAVLLETVQELGLQQRELRSYLQMVLDSLEKKIENDSRAHSRSPDAEVIP